MNPLEAGLVRDKLVNVIYNYGKTRCVVVGRCAESRACLQARALYLDGLGDVEEAGLAADLAKIGLSEGLLHYDVEQGVHHTVVLHLTHGLAREKGLVLDIYENTVLNASEDWSEIHGFSEICRGEHRPTRLHPETQDCVHLLLKLLKNALHDVRVTHVVGED